MLKSVKDQHGHIILYDIYCHGKWIGSRRTLSQAFSAYYFHI